MKWGIIIISYRTRSYTLECLESIYAYPPAGNFEVIVVDNDSQDGTVEGISERFPEVRLAALDKNLGFSEGNNLAFELTQAEIILLLNPDTLVQPGLFDGLSRCLASDPKIGAVGPLQLHPDLSPWQYETWGIGPLTYLLQPLLLRWIKSARTKDVAWLCGACLAVRREVLDQVGKLDVEMFGEDIDLCVRIRAKGHRVRHCAEARIVHYWGTSAATPASARRRVLIGRRSKIYYQAKHHGLFAGLLMTWSIGIECAVRLVVAKLRRQNSAAERERAAAFMELLKDVITFRLLREASQTIATRFGVSPTWWSGIIR